MGSRRAWTRQRVGLLAVAVVLLLLVGGQVVLPVLAERRVRDELGDDRATVDVKAFPAWKLVLGHANRIVVDTPTIARTGRTPLDDLLRHARDVGTVVARIGAVRVDRLRLTDVRLRIHDGTVATEGDLSVRALSALVPGGGQLTPLSPGADGRPRFSARVTVLGVGSDVAVGVAAVAGRVEVRPESGLASLVSITVFQDPALRVRSVSGTVSGDTLHIAFAGDLT